MDSLLSDNKKIGTFLAALGALFMCLGVMLFFDRGLLAIGNLVFIVGLFFLIGGWRLFQFFKSPRRLRGTFCFFLGVVLILLSWTIVSVGGFGDLDRVESRRVASSRFERWLRWAGEEESRRG